MGLKPLKGRIFLARKKAAEKSAGGIHIPEDARDKPQECVVVAVSEDSELEKGETVLIGKYGGNEISVEGHIGVIVKEDEIMGILE